MNSRALGQLRFASAQVTMCSDGAENRALFSAADSSSSDAADFDDDCRWLLTPYAPDAVASRQQGASGGAARRRLEPRRLRARMTAGRQAGSVVQRSCTCHSSSLKFHTPVRIRSIG